jgi:hypothetical protein
LKIGNKPNYRYFDIIKFEAAGKCVWRSHFWHTMIILRYPPSAPETITPILNTTLSKGRYLSLVVL